MNLQQFLLVMLARYKVAIYTLLCTVTAALVINLSLPNEYTATTSVVIDVKSPDPIAGMVLPAMVMPGYMATQVDIINSDRVAQRVVKTLKLDENHDAIEQWQSSTGGKGKIETWLADRLQKMLDVKPSHESNVITIEFKAANPAFAALIANAFAQAYIDTNIDLMVEPAKQYSRWFEHQIGNLRNRLEAAQGRLSAYQQEKGIVANDERLDNETAKLNELSTQLSIAQGQTADSQSKRQSSGAAEMLADVMGNPVILNLKTDISRLEAKQQELAGNLGRNHPQYQRAEAEIATLKQKLASETRQIASSINTSNRVSKSKEGELRTAIEAQKQKLLDLKRKRNELTLLQREVESAQKTYEAVSLRYTQSSLTSQSTQTNISVLASASEPVEPSSPKIMLNTVLALFLGTILGCTAAFATELLDRRVRSAQDMELALEHPILVEVKRPEMPGANWRKRLYQFILKTRTRT